MKMGPGGQGVLVGWVECVSGRQGDSGTGSWWRVCFAFGSLPVARLVLYLPHWRLLLPLIIICNFWVRVIVSLSHRGRE